MKIKKVYRITSPSNFSPDIHTEHGVSKIYIRVPNWAKNNSNICVEELDVKQLSEDEKKEVIEKTDEARGIKSADIKKTESKEQSEDEFYLEEKTKPKIEKISKKIIPDNVESFFICDICGRVCKNAIGLKSHLNKHKKKLK